MYPWTATVYNIFVSLVYSCLDTFETELKFARNEIFCLPYSIQNFSELFVLLSYQQLTINEITTESLDLVSVIYC